MIDISVDKGLKSCQKGEEMKMARILAILLLAISLVFTACSPTTTPPTTPSPTVQPDDTEPTEVQTQAPKEEALPFSWTDGDIKITIHGVFKADHTTREGWIGEDEEQYKVLITYENISNQTVKADATVGRLKIKTSSGNLYDPKYAGGESCCFRLDPQDDYQTHNYAFNIHKNEQPLELWKYDSEDDEQPKIIFSLKELISSPTSTPEQAPSETPESTAPSQPTATTQVLKVYYIDVGQGDSILIDYGQTEMLIDGGDRSPGVVSDIRPYIDGALEAIVATHPHADHIGGLIAVLQQFEVKEIWHNGDSSTSNTYAEFMSAVQNEGAIINVGKRGDQIIVGDLSFTILHPANTSGTTNNNSLVLVLSFGDVDFLFTGDAEQEAEFEMLASSVVPVPDVDILKVGHHGSNTASSQDFISATKPEVAIYMAGEGNSYGHPHQETLITLDDIGAEIYGTDVHGTIIVTTNGQTYDLQLEIPDSPIKPSTVTPAPTPTPSPTPTPTPTPSTTTNVKITKIYYDGQVPRVESDEYVEIKNLGSEPVDLAGWKLVDIDEGYPTFTFPSYNLEPGEIIRVYTNEIHQEYGGFSFGYGKAVWNNSSPDTAVLYDAQGQEVSRKSY